MSALPRAIQGLILFSTLLGVFFLWVAFPLLPDAVRYILAFGWGLFVVDSILTFVRPRVSYFMGFILAVVALAETLTQPEHYQLVANGNVPATVILVLGSVFQALLIGLSGSYLAVRRTEDPWAWPGKDVPDSDVAPAE